MSIRMSEFRNTGGISSLVLTLAAGFAAPMAQATPVDLGNAPPDISSTVNPNIVVTFDDSGSMGATSLPDGMSGNYNRKYYYDPRQNLIYFDPLKDYPPPLRPDGSSFPKSTYTNAWRDGICANWAGSYCATTVVTKNLGTQFHQNFANETSTTNRPNTDTATLATIPTGVRGSSTQNAGFWYECPTANSETGCVQKIIGTAVDPKTTPGDDIRTRFANWYSYYRTRNLMTRTALSRVFGGPALDNKVRVIWQTINADFGGTPSIRSRQVQDLTGTWKNSFFNWMFDVTNNGGTPNRRATIEAGKVFERTLTTDYMNPYWYPPLVSGGTGRNLECRQNFHMLVTDGYWNEGDPTLPTPFIDVSESVTLPDGKIYTPNTALTKVYSNVGTYESSIGNIGFNYWARDLQPTLDNKVPPYWGDRTSATPVPLDNPGSVPEVYWNPANDPATWQHVVQYMVTLGIAGNLAFPGDLTALRAGTKAWPTPSNNSPPAVDDTWHASVNSRGEYFSAKNPAELVDQMTTILTNILTRRGASTSAATSTGVLTSTTVSFVGSYDSADWSGSLLKYRVLSDGSLGSAYWDAGCQLTGGTCPSMGTTTNAPARDPNDRQILTSEGTFGSARPFRWGSLTAAQKAVLNASDSRGEERLNYLRGTRTSETLVTSPLRRRGSVLGAVVNAQPRYYGPVETLYTDEWPSGSPEASASVKFSKFKADSIYRPARVYVAANDGMLHAFNADTGKEEWAYVPNMLFSNSKLKALTDTSTNLVPTVDDRPIIGDAYIGTSWRSFLIGTMRFGARGIYVLDITESDGKESEANKKLRWEFTSTSPGAANLGYTYDSANLARLANGKWVVLLSSGYFPNTGPDSTITPATQDQTSLFVIDLETGGLIRELRTPAGTRSYGLSSPEVVSHTSSNIDDTVFAGDLAGNLWRFDLESSDPAAWSVRLAFQTYDGDATKVGTQPITVNPIAFSDKETSGSKGPIIVFGTGKYLGDTDRLAAGTPTQYMYGIRDYGKTMAVTKLADLTSQTMFNEASGRRSVTRNPIPDSAKGWRMAFPTVGERNVVTLSPVFESNLAIVPTLIPAGDNPCAPARTGAILVLDAQSGGGPGALLDSSFGGSAPGGRSWSGLLVNNPPISGALGIITTPGGGKLILPGLTPVDMAGSGSGSGNVELNVIPLWRRGSWREALDVAD